VGPQCRAGFLGDDKFGYDLPPTAEVKDAEEEPSSPEKEHKRYDTTDYMGYLTKLADKSIEEGRMTSSMPCQKRHISSP
jgi:hypothetical protein